MSQTWQLTI